MTIRQTSTWKSLWLYSLNRVPSSSPPSSFWALLVPPRTCTVHSTWALLSPARRPLCQFVIMEVHVVAEMQGIQKISSFIVYTHLILWHVVRGFLPRRSERVDLIRSHFIPGNSWVLCDLLDLTVCDMVKETVLQIKPPPGKKVEDHTGNWSTEAQRTFEDFLKDLSHCEWPRYRTFNSSCSQIMVVLWDHVWEMRGVFSWVFPEGLRTDGVVCCSDCETPWGRFKICDMWLSWAVIYIVYTMVLVHETFIHTD